jgi:hypothetical protein
MVECHRIVYFTASGRKFISTAFAGYEAAMDRAAAFLRKLGLTAKSLLQEPVKNRALSRGE